jgi:hypothetical protein
LFCLSDKNVWNHYLITVNVPPINKQYKVISTHSLQNYHPYTMPVAVFNPNRHLIMKRAILEELVKINFGGAENSAHIKGNENKVSIGGGMSDDEQLTLLRKAGQEFGKVLEGGADIVTSSAKWIGHIQENWYVFYILCKLIRCGY